MSDRFPHDGQREYLVSADKPSWLWRVIYGVLIILLSLFIGAMCAVKMGE